MAVPGTCFYEYRQAASTSPPRGHPGLEHILSISPPLLRRSSSRSLLLLCSALLQLDANALDARCPAGASIPCLAATTALLCVAPAPASRPRFVARACAKDASPLLYSSHDETTRRQTGLDQIAPCVSPSMPVLLSP